jgi:UDP-glucose 4-epimerase
MKVLVTGGAGYIGSVVAAELVTAGHSVVVADNLHQGHVEAVPSEATFLEVDLRNPSEIDTVFGAHHDIEGVMHFASYTLVGESMAEPVMYLRDNLVAGVNLMDAAAKAGVKRFILSSTANLFDDPERMPIDEDERIVPGSPYGESKFFLERSLYWYERTYGLRYAALRYFNAAGGTPDRGEDHSPELHLIPIVLQVALGLRDSLIVNGSDYPTRDGTCVRDYIHVVDLAQAHILALEALDEPGGRHYNLGNGEGYTILEVIETAKRLTGREIPYTFGPRRAGDPAVLIASSDKIRRELGWVPQYPELAQIIGTAWDWQSRHPAGYSTS